MFVVREPNSVLISSISPLIVFIFCVLAPTFVPKALTSVRKEATLFSISPTLLSIEVIFDFIVAMLYR